MYLKSLEIKNYRPFYGNNYFEFNELDKINIIRGRNGSGKSTLIDAIYWCLYGQELSNFHSQPLCNYDVINEVNVDEEIHVSVICEFTDEDKVFNVKRDVLFIKINELNEFKVVINSFEIYMNDMPVSHVNIFINKHFPKYLFPLLFYDDEYLNSFFNENYVNNLKKVVEDFTLNFLIDKIQYNLNKFSNDYIKRFKHNQMGHDDYGKLLFQQNKIKTNLDEIQQKINFTHEEFSELDNEKMQLEYELSKRLYEFNGNDLQKTRRTLIYDAEDLSKKIQELQKIKFESIIKFFPLIVGLSNVPENVNRGKLEALVQENVDFKSTNFYQSIFILRNPNHEIIHIKKVHEEISNSVELLSRTHEKLCEIDAILSNFDDDEVIKINNKLKHVKKGMYSLDSKLNKLNLMKKDLTKSLKYNERELEKFKNLNQISSSIESKIDFCNDAKEFGYLIKKTLNEKILNESSKVINDIFIDYFNMNYKYKQVIVNESWEISLIKKSNQIISINDLSQSEKGLLKISLTLAIFKCLDLNHPIILMNPFNRLDNEKRDVAISFILENPLNNQLLLIINEDQYENNIRQNLLKFNVTEYSLDDNKGYTEVRRYGY